MYCNSLIASIVVSFLLSPISALPVAATTAAPVASQVTTTAYIAVTLDDTDIPAFPPYTITGSASSNAATITEYVVGFVDQPEVRVPTTVTEDGTTYTTTYLTQL